MHNVREHKQVGDRQDWLQEKLKDITVASAKPQHGQSGNIVNICAKDVLGLKKRKSWIKPIFNILLYQTEAPCDIWGSDSETFFLAAIILYVCPIDNLLFC